MGKSVGAAIFSIKISAMLYGFYIIVANKTNLFRQLASLRERSDTAEKSMKNKL